jgi:ribonuclease HII
LGFRFPAGVDEAGRGAWAGPVSAAAVILPADPHIQENLSGVRDSKQMTPRERGFWAEIIKQKALAWAVATASSREIDQLGIVPATRLAMKRAISQLTPTPEHHPADLTDKGRLPCSQHRCRLGACQNFPGWIDVGP